MEKYKITIKASAVKEIETIPQKRERQRIIRRIGQLASDPRPSGCTKLSGLPRYRVRQGSYRIVYEIDDADLMLCIVKIGHRKEVYRGK